MADERRAQEFDAAAAVVGYLGAAIGGRKLVNPYRLGEEEEWARGLTPAQARAETKEFMFTLGVGLRAVAAERGR